MEECAVVNIGGMRGLKIKRVYASQGTMRIPTAKEKGRAHRYKGQNIKADNATYSVA